jgi:membrane-anchored mycosin MYCP
MAWGRKGSDRGMGAAGGTTKSRGRAPRAASATIAALIGLATVFGGVTPAHADAVRDAEYWLSDYGIRDAWNTTRGAGVTIAVIDTGISSGPAEFNGAVAAGYDASGVGSPDGRTPLGQKDEKEHGSWVGSLAAGRGAGGDNGVLGAAPDATLLSVSVGFRTSGSTVPFEDQIASGIRWAVDNGADVINMSLTTNTLDWPESWDDAFKYAFEHNVVVVAAAGNRGSGTEEVGAPATIPGVLVVGGVKRDKTASFDASSQGITISVAAPSEELVGVSPDGSYVGWSGTSGASPIVAGIVALVKAKYPDLDAGAVIDRVVKTATPAPGQGAAIPSPIYGYGLVDARAAVTADVPAFSGAGPAEQLQEWITVHRRASATSVPVPTDTSTPKPLPPADAAARPNPFLPTTETLLYVSIPLAVLLGTGTLVLLGAIGVTRHFRRVAHRE